MTEAVTPNFKRMAQMVQADLVIKPLVEAYLHEAKFPDVFSVKFYKEGRARRPDGWFHPSTHPVMDERKLLLYLTEPEHWEDEVLSYESRMAVVMGTAVHGFMQVCMIDAGVLVKPEGTCVACGREHGTKKGQCQEWGAIDRSLGRRGHMDGMARMPIWTGNFEFKTINPRAAIGLNDGDLDWLKKRHWDYYMQVQDYLDMTGQAEAIILFCILGFPWRLVEIRVPYDYAAALKLRSKYERVRAAEKAYREVGRDAGLAMIDPCCAPRSKESKVCPARSICPIGRL